LASGQPKTDSVVAFRNSQGESAKGVLIRLARTSIVFEVYNPYSIVQLSEVLPKVEIRRGERTIYEGKAVVTSIVSTGIMLIVTASMVDPWSDLAGLKPGPQLREEVDAFVGEWQSNNRQLQPNYRVAVGNIVNFLDELRQWLEHGELVAGIDNSVSPELANEFTADVEDRVSNALDELFGQYEAETRQIETEVVGIHKAHARREIHPLMLISPFMHRTFTKPLGYAGDYEMVNMILRNEYEGSNTYAKVVNSILLRSDVAEAHRNRIVRLHEVLREEATRVRALGRRLKVLNIGCGPAVEIQRFLADADLSEGVEFELVDFNDETLNYTRSQIQQAMDRHQSKPEVTFTHRSVHEILKLASDKRIEIEPKYDLVYCAGLFDYLSDKICTRLMSLFYRWTLPDGITLSTNVHERHPVRGCLEHVLEWYLLVRNEQGMYRLAGNLPNPRVYTETTGVNVFLEIRKPSETQTSSETQT